MIISNKHTPRDDLKDIPEFQGLYAVSPSGEMYSHISNKYLIISYNKLGYQQVSLRKEGKQYSRRVHRLVALTHIENPDNLPEVNHRDGDKDNNHVNNLEWSSRSQNMIHAWRSGLMYKTRKHLAKTA